MRIHGRLVERYVVASTLPYFLMALSLLTTVLLAQQSARFGELLGSAGAPLALAGRVALGLLPNVLIFTLPMSVLIGTATGFSRMGGDSELIAMQSAGLGRSKIVLPMVLMGLVFSVLTFGVGFVWAPEAAFDLRQTALSAAIYRLESPVEPRSFNTEIPGKVIYVRDGNAERGEWGRVFIHWREKDGSARLITSRAGRIDSSGEQAELVLTDAVVTHIASDNAKGGNEREGAIAEITSERSTQLRIREDKINTGRAELFRRMRGRGLELDELGWRELSARARSATDPTDQRGAQTALHKRLSLCVAPLLFALCGAGLGVRARRGGRGLGVMLSLSLMISYYLLALAGESLARGGLLPPILGAWLASIFSLVFGLLLITPKAARLLPEWPGRGRKIIEGRERARVAAGADRSLGGRLRVAGLLDRYVIRSLTLNFTLALITLASIFLIFTLFEMLRFIAGSGAGASLVGKYLFFLLPLAIVSLIPMSALVSALAGYAMMAKRSEAIAWWSSGQSVYRLAAPGLVFALGVGALHWGIQERLMPPANRLQDALRTQIKDQGKVSRVTTQVGLRWLAVSDGNQIFSYEYDEAGAGSLLWPTMYEFDEESIHLKRVIYGERGTWGNSPGTLQISAAQVVEVGGTAAAAAGGGRAGVRQTATVSTGGTTATPDLFKPTLKKPSEMDIKQLSGYVKSVKRRGESSGVASLMVEVERKRAAPFAPLVLTVIAIPLALSFGRRGALASLLMAVAVGLAFWGASSGFQQLGAYGLLPTTLAAWGPALIFASVGLYMLFRART